MKSRTDDKKADERAVNRRGFLKSIGGASVAGAAIAVGAPAPAEAAESDEVARFNGSRSGENDSRSSVKGARSGEGPDADPSGD